MGKIYKKSFKQKKRTSPQILNIRNNLGAKFCTSLNWELWIFGPNLPKKGIFSLYTQISVGIKFQLKLGILIFWTKFAHREFFQSKTEKVKIIIEFCIFALV